MLLTIEVDIKIVINSSVDNSNSEVADSPFNYSVNSDSLNTITFGDSFWAWIKLFLAVRVGWASVYLPTNSLPNGGQR